MSADPLALIEVRLQALEQRYRELTDRVRVMEECTCDHENRLEDLETWQEKADDLLDEY